MAADIGDDEFDTSYRVDDGDIQRTRWYESNTNEATLVPPGYTEKFLSDIYEGKRLIVRVVDYSSESHTAEFDLTGIEWAFEQLPCRFTQKD